MKKIFYFIIAITIFFSCNKVDCPNEVGCVEPDCPFGTDTLINESGPTTQRNILILEYTGYKCNNCPEGAKVIDNLKSSLGSQLVPVSIHAGQYAEPGTFGGHDFVTDFRNKAGNELEELFLPIGYPTAVINMKKFDDRYQNGRDSWEGLINSEISDAPNNLAVLSVNSYYSEKFNTLYASADVFFPEETETKYNMMFLLIEEEVIDVQLDGPDFIEDYEHKHVLRSAFGKTLGSTVNSESMAANEKYTVSASCTELNEEWDVAKLEIVAVLYDAVTLEVAQVQPVHVK